MKKYLFITLLFVAVIVNNMMAQTKPLSEQMAATAMKLWPDTVTLAGKAKWNYDQGVIMKGFEAIWKNTADPQYFNYIQNVIDAFVTESGDVNGYKKTEYNIDHINNAKELLFLYRVTGKEKYWKAAGHFREQLRHHPRTNEGGFWHKQIYPNQMWLDGLYMGQPFYAEYAMLAHEDTTFNDITNQFVWMENHARDTKTGLLYHGWDESKQQKWADPKTGLSPNFWGRAMGWYGMALVDALEYFPANHPGRAKLIAILNRFADAVAKVQDKKTGLWYDILDKPNEKGNYLEASASSMFVCAIAKGVRLGYLPASKIAIAQNGYKGILNEFIKTENGQVNLHGTVSVSGLGGNPYRDGSFAYYMSEKVIVNDGKGVGAFLQAAAEMEIQPLGAVGKGKAVLLDRYFNHESRKDMTGTTQAFHYVWDEMDLNGYSMFGYAFQKRGASIAQLETAPTAADLKKASVYIVVDPDTKKENPQPNFIEDKDVKVIADWVKAGGVLLLFANDSANVELPHFNKLAGAFGIHFNDESRNMVKGHEYETGALMINPGNEIFTNTQKVYMKEISTLGITTPAKANLAAGKDVIIAVAKVGKGTVFAVGDPWLYNEYTDGRKIDAQYQNNSAANDLANWALKLASKK